MKRRWEEDIVLFYNIPFLCTKHAIGKRVHGIGETFAWKKVLIFVSKNSLVEVVVVITTVGIKCIKWHLSCMPNSRKIGVLPKNK